MAKKSDPRRNSGSRGRWGHRRSTAGEGSGTGRVAVAARHRRKRYLSRARRDYQGVSVTPCIQEAIEKLTVPQFLALRAQELKSKRLPGGLIITPPVYEALKALPPSHFMHLQTFFRQEKARRRTAAALATGTREKLDELFLDVWDVSNTDEPRDKGGAPRKLNDAFLTELSDLRRQYPGASRASLAEKLSARLSTSDSVCTISVRTVARGLQRLASENPPQ